jgi:hypothetical protein
MDVHKSSPLEMLKGIHSLLDEADVVVHYNGTSFDIPTLNKEFIKFSMSPPSPYKQIDLYRTARSQFRFTSNKLDHVAEELGLGKKIEHRGFQLWVDCMENKNTSAWKEMETYNVHDVILLERVYDRFKPWVKNHPNQNLYSNGEHVCPACGGNKLHKRGTSYTISGKYQRYQCLDCKKWSRNVKKNKESLAITGAA